MPEQVSMEEFANRIRERRPDLSHIPTIELVSKTLQAAPDLKQFVMLDSLGASREAASKGEFESALPQQTSGTAAREAGLSVAEGAQKLFNPTPADIASTLKWVANAGWDMVSGKGSAKAQQGIADTVSPVGDWASSLAAGNTDAAASAAGRILTQTVPAVGGALEGANALKGAMKGSLADVSLPGSKYMTNQITAPRLNNILEVPNRSLSPALDPGARIIQDKIIAASQTSLLAKMRKRLGGIGPQLEHKLSQDAPGLRINVEASLDRAIENGRKDINLTSVEGFEGGLDKLKEGVVDFAHKEFGPTAELRDLNALQAQRVKSFLGEHGTKWRGVAAESGLNQVRMEAYGGIMDDLKEGVPGITDLLHQWGDYEIGSRALADKLLRTKYGIKAGPSGITIKGMTLPTSTMARTVAGRLFREPMEGPPPLGAVPDGIPRDTVNGQILMRSQAMNGLFDPNNALLPGTHSPNPDWTPATPAADIMRRDSASGELLMPPDVPQRAGPGLAQGGKAFFDTKPTPGIKGLLPETSSAGREMPSSTGAGSYPAEPLKAPKVVNFQGARMPTRPPLGMADPIISAVSDNMASSLGSVADYGKLKEIVTDIDSLYKNKQVDAMQQISHIVEEAGGSPDTLIRVMSRPEGLNAVQKLVRAQKRAAVKDVLYWQDSLKAIVDRDNKRP